MVAAYPHDSHTLRVRVNYIPAFHADLEEFEKWFGDKYEYEFIKPLVQAGMISLINRGLVKNYGNGKTFIRFWLGKNPNEGSG